VNAALPVLIGALARNASTPNGATALNDALSEHDGSALDNVASVVNNPDSHDGGGILAHILGNRSPMVANGIGQATGINVSQATSLLSMLAPLVMGALGKAQRGGNLDSGALASMLGREHQTNGASTGALGGLMSMLDSNHDGSIADDVMGMAGKFFGKK
ncbi:MAG: DUF937 domain-containing protein, partial [Gemmatimonadota bacterium]|nr:DUF937 domain-containing protein [Gemmatimonadota bacterium]